VIEWSGAFMSGLSDPEVTASLRHGRFALGSGRRSLRAISGHASPAYRDHMGDKTIKIARHYREVWVPLREPGCGPFAHVARIVSFYMRRPLASGDDAAGRSSTDPDNQIRAQRRR
jgi:hypothetical protein